MNKINRRAALILGGLALAPPGWSQAFPTAPVKIVVPFSAGAVADIVARQLAQGLSKVWGQGVVIENVAGAAGNIGAARVVKAPADGYTLLMLGINHAINPSLYKDTQYDLVKDFKPIARVSSVPMVIVANPPFPASNIAQLVAMAKDPAKPIYYGSGGGGSATQLAIEMLASQAGIKLNHVPYKSIAPMLTDILGNQVSLGAIGEASVIAQVKAGKLKVLASTSAQRSAAFPDVPTVAESGYPGFEVASWNGLLAPVGTPDAIVDKIAGDVAQVVQSEDFTRWMREQSIEGALLGPAPYGVYLRQELLKWAKLVRETHTKVD